MTDSPILPGAHAWKDAQGKPLPVEFFKFLRDLQSYIQQTTGNAESLDAIAARILALEEAPPASIRGIGSIDVKNGTAQLIGDEDNLGGTHYYGTNYQGQRGWWEVISAFDAGPGISKDRVEWWNVLGTLDNPGELPPSANVNDAYIISGDYWAWLGTEWSNEGAQPNVAVLGMYRGFQKDDGLLWDPAAIPPDYEVAPIVRNPMTTTGDLIYSSPDSTPVRLGIGAEGDVLQVAAGVPVWAAAAAGQQIYNRITADGDVRITADGDLRITD